MLIAIDTRELSDPQVGSGAGVSHYIWGIVRALLKQGQEHTFLIFLDPSIRKDSIEVLLKDGKYVEIQQINTHQYPFFSNHFLEVQKLRICGRMKYRPVQPALLSVSKHIDRDFIHK